MKFTDPDGNLLYKEINVGGNDKYKYYYYNEESVAESMSRVHATVTAKKLTSTSSHEKDAETDRAEL